jgi:hypothetical protein
MLRSDRHRTSLVKPSLPCSSFMRLPNALQDRPLSGGRDVKHLCSGSVFVYAPVQHVQRINVSRPSNGPPRNIEQMQTSAGERRQGLYHLLDHHTSTIRSICAPYKSSMRRKLIIGIRQFPDRSFGVRVSTRDEPQRRRKLVCIVVSLRIVALRKRHAVFAVERLSCWHQPPYTRIRLLL